VAVRRGDARRKRLKVLSCAVAEEGPAVRRAGEVVAAGRDGIWVACGSGVLRLVSVQPEGGKVMDAWAYAQGPPPGKGDRLS
jgi:methionyl-tRNA formyltransferase